MFGHGSSTLRDPRLQSNCDALATSMRSDFTNWNTILYTTAFTALAAENSEASRALAVVTSLLKIQEILWHPQFQCFTRTTCRIQDSTLLGLSFSYKMCDSRPAKGEHVQGLWWGLPDRKLSCSQNPSLPSTWKQDPTSGEYFLLESQHVGFIAWMALRLSQSPSASIPRGWVASETGGNGAGHTL